MDTAVYCVGFNRAAGKSMRDVYVNGLANVMSALPRPRRFLYVSSTGTYGQSAGQEVAEDAVTEPDDEPGKIVLEAEQLLRRRLPETVILRFAGIYGPGRLIRGEALRSGEPLAGDPEKLLNLIHVEDGAAAVLAAEARAQPGATVNISDDLPVRRRDFYEFLAQLIGAPEPRFILPAPGDAQPRAARPNRRIVNRRMHEELMVQLRYPSYRGGLPAALASQASNLSP
jgi:nucleoside-diphosphate-sugar epimerase